jgi:peptidoglycan/xylan/chitin deacetylase (PgdA/CDA1 family)
MLTWDQVREMRGCGIEFGAHTVSHPLLARLPREQARWQLEESKRVIERELGERVRHFAFPAGSATDELIELAREVGFESLYVRDRRRRVHDHRSSPWGLTRLGATDDPVAVVATEMAGIFDWLRPAVR